MGRLKAIFSDRLMKAAGAIFLLIVIFDIFNFASPLPFTFPQLGVFTFLMVPILFILGGIVFIMAIIKIARQM